MKTRIASWAVAGALTISTAVAAAAPAAADPVPGNQHQFYAYCAIDLFARPVSCVQSDAAHASHICQYVLTVVGVGLDCIRLWHEGPIGGTPS